MNPALYQYIIPGARASKQFMTIAVRSFIMNGWTLDFTAEYFGIPRCTLHGWYAKRLEFIPDVEDLDTFKQIRKGLGK